jgi:hypothetical protein
MSTFSNTAREVEMPNGDIVKLHDAVTPNSTSNIKKFKYDDNGHVTESEAANATDLNLNSYSTPTSGTTAIGASDPVQTAIGKLDHQSHIDQTNILYVADNGGKNKFNCDPIVLQPMNTVGTWSGNAYTVSSKIFTINNGEITVSGGQDQYNTARMVIFKGDIPAGTKITGCPAGGATAGIDSYCIGVYDSNDYFVTADIGNGVSITNDLTNVTVCVTKARGAMSSSLVFKPMLCTVDAWNISHEFVPCSLPNSDLTRLEAEDRASLAEVVDSGAKNLVNLANKSISATGYMYDKEGIPDLPAGSYAWSASGSYISSLVIVLYNSSNNEVGRLSTDDSSYPYFTTTGTATKITLYVTKSASGASASLSNIMICTKAAFGVSSKFVPYRVPINGVFWAEKYEARSTTLVSTGIKFTASKQTIYRITATAQYGNSKPTQLVIKKKLIPSESEGNFVAVSSDTNSQSLTATGIMTLGVGGYFEVYAAYDGTTSNRVYAIVEEVVL